MFSVQEQNHKDKWNQYPDKIRPDRVDSLLTSTNLAKEHPSLNTPSWLLSLTYAGFLAVLWTHQACSCPPAFVLVVPPFLECSSQTSAWPCSAFYWGPHSRSSSSERSSLTIVSKEEAPIFSFLFLFFFLFFFLGPHPQHVGVPGLGVESELQLPAYATATAMQDPSQVCDLHHSSRQLWTLNLLSEARDRTCNLMITSQIHFHCTTWELQEVPSYVLSFSWHILNCYDTFICLCTKSIILLLLDVIITYPCAIIPWCSYL